MDTRAAYRQCEEITWSQARNFSYGIRLLPPAKRRALAAVYAFARRIDDIGDGTMPAPDKLAALGDARASVTALAAGAAPAQPPAAGPDPVLIALADASRRFAIPLDAFGELIDGCEADVRGTTYGTFDDLLHYCRCVAGSVGRLSLGVFGTPDAAVAAPLADALGVALQLTNILRDIVEDRQMGRRYLAEEDIERFGCRSDLTGPPEAMRALVEHEVAIAQRFYDRGLRLLPLLDRRSRACVSAMAGIYRGLLARIAADPLAVTRGRLSLSTKEKLWVAARSLAGATP
jgi:phytoene synthase